MNLSFAGLSTEQLQQTELMARRALRIDEARDDLLTFARLMMPDPDCPEDPDRSMYRAAPHHRLIATALERVERGECGRLAIDMPPQHGKSLLTSRLFLAWYIGRNPTKNIIFGTYSETFAAKFGGEVREFIMSPVFQAIFPGVKLRSGSKAKDEMYTTAGGQLNFVGRGGRGSGIPADIFVIDDPIKNAEEASSKATVEQLHEWYGRVVFARARATTAIAIIQTRWMEDDLIGRRCDPDHSDYDEYEAAKWTHLSLPAVIKAGPVADALDVELVRPENERVIQMFGDEPMAVLWPEQFTLEHFAEAKKNDPLGFEALYQGRPTPEDGEYFKKEWLVVHDSPDEYPTPDRLRQYAASDHALTEKEENDATCMGPFGVDENDHIWISPELVWDRFETDVLLDLMIAIMKLRKPQVWFAESEHIEKSIGPFRRKRQMEEGAFTLVQPLKSVKDLRSRARPIQGRMAMKMVHFPGWAPWWPKARAELLKFPRAKHDDFVSFLSLVGRGMDQEIGASKQKAPDNVIRVGSIEWIKGQSRVQARREKLEKAVAGW